MNHIFPLGQKVITSVTSFSSEIYGPRSVRWAHQLSHISSISLHLIAVQIHLEAAHIHLTFQLFVFDIEWLLSLKVEMMTEGCCPVATRYCFLLVPLTKTMGWVCMYIWSEDTGK